jgi:hypothetical protein
MAPSLNPKDSEPTVEALLQEKKEILNLQSRGSKDGFINKLRRLVRLERHLSRKKK